MTQDGETTEPQAEQQPEEVKTGGASPSDPQPEEVKTESAPPADPPLKEVETEGGPPADAQPEEVKTEDKPQADPHIILNELDKETQIAGDAPAETEPCAVSPDSAVTGEPRQGGPDEMIAEAMARLDEILVELNAKKA